MTARADEGPPCLNCGAAVTGQYCGQCGQRATTRLISLWELVSDAFGDLCELDSRLWRTMLPLLVRPGHLTRDYLQGRRARYMPPFRMYLVLSLLFFLIAFFDPHDQLAIFYETPAETAAVDDLEKAARRQEARETLEALVAEGVLDESVLAPDGPLGDIAPEIDSGTAAPDGADPPGLSVRYNDDEAECLSVSGEFDSAPAWFKRRFSKERIEQVCERVKAAGAAGVAKEVLDNMPIALLVLLPIMAFVLKLMYPLSRRYYVEHLLFFVHFHAFLFVLITLQVLWTRLISLIGLNEAIAVLPVVATSFYVPVYLYKSMRRVYGQGHLWTTLKLVALTGTYLFMLTIMIAAALLFAVFSL